MDGMHTQLSEISAEQSRLWGAMRSLDTKIDALKESAKSPALKPKPKVEPVPKPKTEVTAKAERATPPPLPVSKPEPIPAPKAETTPPPLAPSKEEKPKESLELRLGTVWFVRIGVVMLLTGLVFLSKFAYSNFINDLPAGVKVLGLYFLSFGLTGVGVFFGRKKGNEKLQMFGRVLAAGGLAAVYYTTYAAHYVERLRVIENPILAGFLLLLSVLPILGYAVWRKSQTVAGVALALALYTSIMSPVGWFSMFSSLLLAAAGVAFLLRFRWAAIGFASLIGTYAAFAFWQYLHPMVLSGSVFPEVTWGGLGYLVSYFVLFTAAVFFPKKEALSLPQRTSLACLNNAAFLGLFTLGILEINRDAFWIFGIASGVVLLALAWASAERFGKDARLLTDSYLIKGLAFFTLGVAAKLSGYQLALALAAQAAVLTAFFGRRENLVLLAGGFLLAVLAMLQLETSDDAGVLTHLLITTLLWVAAWDLRKMQPKLAPMGKVEEQQIGLFPLMFALMGMAALAMGLSDWVKGTEQLGVALVITGLVLAALGTTFRNQLPELTYVSQPFAAVGALFMAMTQGNSILGIGSVLALSLIWGWRGKPGRASTLLEAGFAGLFTLCLMVALTGIKSLGAEQWIWLSSVVAAVLMVVSVPLRNRPLALFGYAVQIVGLAAFIEQIEREASPQLTILFPIALLLTTALVRLPLIQRSLSEISVKALTYVGTIGATLGHMGWCFVHFPAAAPLILAISSAPLLFWKRSLPFGGALLGLAILVFTVRCVPGALVSADFAPRWIDLVIPVLSLGAAQLLRRSGSLQEDLRPPLAAGLSLIALLSVFLFFTFHVPALSGHLTATWSVLALIVFGGGVLLGDRPIRLAGLALLALGLGRILIFDVWKLPTEARFISFFVIGGVLVALGFVYNRFQDTIRKFL